jgi:hypothetical protein
LVSEANSLVRVLIMLLYCHHKSLDVPIPCTFMLFPRITTDPFCLQSNFNFRALCVVAWIKLGSQTQWDAQLDHRLRPRDPDLTLASTTMDECLSIPEILPLLCDGLEAKDLLSTALSCRAYLEPALDKLWYHVKSFKPLIACLPEDLVELRTESVSETLLQATSTTVVKTFLCLYLSLERSWSLTCFFFPRTDRC